MRPHVIGSRDHSREQWEHDVPDELDDLLHEQAPGRQRRNFRLAVRMAWCRAVESGEGMAVDCGTPQQVAVVGHARVLFERLRGKT